MLAALLDGCSNQGMCDRLGFGLQTARHHVFSICRKLGVDSRLQVALFAIRNHLVEFEYAPVNPLTKPITCTREQLTKQNAASATAQGETDKEASTRG